MAARGERGQSLVELAIIAPILVFFVLGLAELGNGLHSYITVVNAGRDGARLGASSGDDQAIRDLIGKETGALANALPTACNGDAPGVCITRSGSGESAAIEVEVCYDHPLFVGIPGLLDDDLRMCSSTTMRAAQGS